MAEIPKPQSVLVPLHAIPEHQGAYIPTSILPASSPHYGLLREIATRFGKYPTIWEKDLKQRNGSNIGFENSMYIIRLRLDKAGLEMNHENERLTFQMRFENPDDQVQINGDKQPSKPIDSRYHLHGKNLITMFGDTFVTQGSDSVAFAAAGIVLQQAYKEVITNMPYETFFRYGNIGLDHNPFSLLRNQYTNRHEHVPQNSISIFLRENEDNPEAIALARRVILQAIDQLWKAGETVGNTKRATKIDDEDDLTTYIKTYFNDRDKPIPNYTARAIMNVIRIQRKETLPLDDLKLILNNYFTEN